MNLPLRILDVAVDDIRARVQWYERRQRGLGSRFLRALHVSLAAIEACPSSHSHLETVADEIPIHRLLLKKFPFLVIYEICSNEVVVLAVAHVRRRSNYWMSRRQY